MYREYFRFSLTFAKNVRPTLIWIFARTRFLPFKTAWLVVCHPFRACEHGLRPLPRHSDAAGYFLLFSSLTRVLSSPFTLFEGVFECVVCFSYSFTGLFLFLSRLFLFTPDNRLGGMWVLALMLYPKTLSRWAHQLEESKSFQMSPKSVS